MTRLFSISVIALALAASFNSARAEDRAQDTHSVAVHYADLDLRTEAGVAKLYARIGRAAKAACAAQSGSNALTDFQVQRACKRDAMDRAVASADLAALTNWHYAMTGRGGVQLASRN